MKTRNLELEGALLNKQELYEHLEKIAGAHIVKSSSAIDTYPIPRMIENYKFIKQV